MFEASFRFGVGGTSWRSSIDFRHCNLKQELKNQNKVHWLKGIAFNAHMKCWDFDKFDDILADPTWHVAMNWWSLSRCIEIFHSWRHYRWLKTSWKLSTDVTKGRVKFVFPRDVWSFWVIGNGTSFESIQARFLTFWQAHVCRWFPSRHLNWLDFDVSEVEKWQSRNDLSCEKLGCVFGYNPVSESGRMTAKAWRSTTLRWRHHVLCILCVSDISVYCWKVGVRHDSPGNVGSFATAPAWNTKRSAIPETWMLQMSYSSRIPGMFCHRFGSGIQSHPWGLLHAHHHRHGSCPKHWQFPHKDGQTRKWSKNNFMDWWECALSNMRRYPAPGYPYEGWASLFEIPRMYDSMTKAIWLWLVFLPADSCELFCAFQTTNEAPTQKSQLFEFRTFQAQQCLQLSTSFINFLFIAGCWRCP